MTDRPEAPSRAEDAIRRRIGDADAITFAEFMGLALYHPVDGYYTRPGARTGREGDFSTSSDVSPAFGGRLAVQAAEIWERLGGGAWRIVELGPGRGLLAADLVRGLADSAPRAFEQLAELVLVEISPALAEEQHRRLAAAAPGRSLRWVRALHELPASSVAGLVVGNEFLDALPVHILVRRGGALSERCVALDEDGAFCFVERSPRDARLASRIERHGLAPREGDVAEVGLELETVVADVGRVLARGAVLFIDYGLPAARLADEDHAAGTLLAYHRHRVETDLLARPGRQDLTAFVNWDHLAEAARENGFAVAGRTTQDKFLLALGLAEDLAPQGDPGAEAPEALARRLAARSLILPGAGGGRRFEAMLLVKGIAPDLRGLSDPFSALR